MEREGGGQEIAGKGERERAGKKLRYKRGARKLERNRMKVKRQTSSTEFYYISCNIFHYSTKTMLIFW